MITNLDIGSAIRSDVNEIIDKYLGTQLTTRTPNELEHHLNDALMNYKWRGQLDDDYKLYVTRDDFDPGRLNVSDQKPENQYVGHLYS